METPDKWMLVRITGATPHWRIFATWSGGYTQGDSWRLNSGISRVEDKDEYFDFIGYSGSLYRCFKNSYGVTAYGIDVLNDLVSKSTGFMEPVWEEPSNIGEMLNV